ncbi:flagellar hook assembly protein FlgD [Sphingomonas sp. HT-1]|uniref:flagellar hook assembly protein FlgD n=1 Tax=unclassified Sphingomonas TaxID=196159 RepID=UPI00030AAC9B|nr:MULTISPECIES: flagellar hook capping FlgD N-terminal domain-containing protein [unclassified Sphingomonas]KTF70591.1 flagellar biosynthesis protein FlgD [Sphingomonas sp. WG]
MTLVTSATTTTSTTTDAASSKLTADYSLFLKLLTTQMQNQDPMNPMDSSQFTQQLVQYSQVEQSIQQNKTLNTMLSTMNMQSLTQSSSMIGQAVEVDSDMAATSATKPAQWNWIAANAVTSVTAKILDSKGSTVDTRTFDATGTSGSFTWDGTTKDGKALDPGIYRVELTGSNATVASIKMTASAAGTVDNVQMINGSPVVSINDAQYPTSLITRIQK